MLKAVEPSRVAWCWHLERESNSLTSIPDLYVVMKETGEKKYGNFRFAIKAYCTRDCFPGNFLFSYKIGVSINFPGSWRTWVVLV